MKLNLGCGRQHLANWVNVDIAALPGVDVVHDITKPLPFQSDVADELLLSHVIEHIAAPLPLMEEMWRVAKPGAKLVVRCPYGSSDDAFEDPTHVRQYFRNSWGYFSQPFYWRADYGYRGDWQVTKVRLMVPRGYEGMPPREIVGLVDRERNVVREMVAELRAVKPAREARKELQEAPALELVVV